MEKNITPGMSGRKKPDFLRIFLITLVAYLAITLLLGRKTDAPATAEIPTSAEVPRVPVPFTAARVMGNFNSVGLRFDDLLLRDYRTAATPDAPNVRILGTEPERKFGNYIEFGFMPAVPEDASLFPSNTTAFRCEPPAVDFANGDAWKCRWTSPKGVEFIRSATFDQNFMLSIEYEIINKSGQTVSFFPYGRVVAGHDMTTPETIAHIGFTGFIGGKMQEITWSDMLKSSMTQFTGTDGWLGFGDVYFMSALRFGQNVSGAAEAETMTGGENVNIRVMPLKHDKATNTAQFQADYVAGRMNIEAGSAASVRFASFLGAKEPKVLAGYDVPKMALAVDYGILYLLTRPFVAILSWLNSFTHNFGIAIILFTIMVRLALFPIAQKSFRSMEQMRRLSPEIKRIQTVYAHDKQRMNMEIAMLYKTHKINPLSGCLPLLLQLPVFIALYKALIISIDMRHAPFMLWLHDLSAADPTNIWNLFGILPYTPWTWLPAVGILPIIMGVTMYVQQIMQPMSAGTESMQKVMRLLPIIFTFIFAGLPSGLVLYWTVNNILSILQQRFMGGAGPSGGKGHSESGAQKVANGNKKGA